MGRAKKRTRNGDEIPQATKNQSIDAALAIAAASGNAPQEESEEENLIKKIVADAASDTARPAKKRKTNKPEAPTLKEIEKRITAWAEHSSKVERWIASRGGLEPALESTPRGILRFRDFFPLEIADLALTALETIPEDVWELSEQGGDDAAANHRFWSADLTDVPCLGPLRSVFWQLLKTYKDEPTMPIFSIGRYGATDHIGRHDDRAHVPFFNDGNIFSRTVAGIWYLTRDWSESHGGCLRDLEKPSGSSDSEFVPLYNSLVAFEVPHMHEVTKVTSDRYRYSIFGWWHQKGKRYELQPAPRASKKKKNQEAQQNCDRTWRC